MIFMYYTSICQDNKIRFFVTDNIKTHLLKSYEQTDANNWEAQLGCIARYDPHIFLLFLSIKVLINFFLYICKEI